MKRGEIWMTDYEPSFGHEPSKVRPAVIVSNDYANDSAARLGRGLLTLIPLTSNVAHVFDHEVFLPADETGLSLDSKAQVQMIRGVDSRRLQRRVGSLSLSRLFEVEQAISLHLALD